MNWKAYLTAAGITLPLVIMLTVMWYQLDSKIDSRITHLDARIERVQLLLTENLITLNRDLGELAGASHTHTSD